MSSYVCELRRSNFFFAIKHAHYAFHFSISPIHHISFSLSLSLSLSISTKRIECVLGIINYSLSYCMDINLFCFMLLHNILLITEFGIFRASSKLPYISIFQSFNEMNSLFQNDLIEMTEIAYKN